MRNEAHFSHILPDPELADVVKSSGMSTIPHHKGVAVVVHAAFVGLDENVGFIAHGRREVDEGALHASLAVVGGRFQREDLTPVLPLHAAVEMYTAIVNLLEVSMINHFLT